MQAKELLQQRTVADIYFQFATWLRLLTSPDLTTEQPSQKSRDRIASKLVESRTAFASAMKTGFRAGELEDLLALCSELSELDKGGTLREAWAASEQVEVLRIPEVVPGVDVRIGTSAAFSESELAAIHFVQAWQYMQRGTLGDDFPLEDPMVVLEVMQEMFQLQPDDLVFLLSQSTASAEGRFLPLVSARISLGKNSSPVLESQGTTRATLPTLWALQLTEGAAHAKANEWFMRMPETELACMGRFCSNEEALAHMSLQRLPQLLIPFGAVGIARYAERMGVEIRAAVCDTHIRSLQRTLPRLFGAQLLASGEGVRATPQVLETPSGRHYGTFQHTLSVFALNLAEYVSRSEQILAGAGIMVQSSERKE